MFGRGVRHQAILLVTILLSIIYSASLGVRPVSAYIGDISVSPTSVNAHSGAVLETFGFTVSTTYSGCWGPCEATWFGAFVSAPFISTAVVPTGCSVRNGNPIWWSGTCAVTVHIYVNSGGITPPGTYPLMFYVYTFTPDYRLAAVTLIVT
jgi:hypothetical protein